MSTKPFDFLEDTEPEFGFIEGLEGGSHIVDLAGDTGFFEAVPAYLEGVSQFSVKVPELKRPKGPATPSSDLNSVASQIQRLTGSSRPKGYGGIFPIEFLVLQRPEGWGKSTLIGDMANGGNTVVFCAKSNEQLAAHEASFRQRWPHLKIHRHVSKAQHIKEVLARAGVAFDVIYRQGATPYAPATVDETATLTALRQVLDAANFESDAYVQVFQRLFVDYQAKPVIGNETNILLITLSAFQAACASPHRSWWEKLGFVSGAKRSVERRGKYVELEVCIGGLVVVIDDPDRSDFDSRRLIEDHEKALSLRDAREISSNKKARLFERYWLDKGFGPLVSQRLAAHEYDSTRKHDLEEFNGRLFEKRPANQRIGFRLQRGTFGMQRSRPLILVTTTEHLTARYAVRSLQSTLYPGLKGEGKGTPMLNCFLPSTQRAHVTLLASPITRKGNHALLLLIAEVLRREFPGENLALIADGLGCELNLSSSRGRNDIADRATLVKLSVPNPSLALNVWAHFPRSESPRSLNALLLADIANQALGRNQGQRFRGRPAMIVVDPIYALALGESGLLRYACSPWSSHKPQETRLAFYDQPQPIEVRLMQLLERRTYMNLGLASIDAIGGGRHVGLNLAADLSDKGREHYGDWLLRQGMRVPWRMNE